MVFDSGVDTTNKTSITASFEDFYVPTMAGDTSSHVATVTHTDNNDGESLPSADSSTFGVEFVEDSGWDAVNKLTSTSTGLTVPETYLATVEHQDNNGGISSPSVVDEFTTAAAASGASAALRALLFT